MVSEYVSSHYAFLEFVNPSSKNRYIGQPASYHPLCGAFKSKEPEIEPPTQPRSRLVGRENTTSSFSVRPDKLEVTMWISLCSVSVIESSALPYSR